MGSEYQLMKPIEARDGALGWMKVAARAGRENGGRWKKEERRKNGGRKGVCYIKDKGASLVGAQVWLQGIEDIGAIHVDWGRTTRAPMLMTHL
jgi:hypothetical protein